MKRTIDQIRKEYIMQSLDERQVCSDPVEQFGKWWDDAIESGIEEVNAMTLATADKQGIPSARVVLLKGFDSNGFVFFTNYQSRKGNEIEANPHVSAVLYWKELERQVRIEGVAARLDEKSSDAYFSSRPEGSRIGAWASPQSRVIESREELEKLQKEAEQRFAGKPISRPPHWGGYVIKPHSIEFWQGRSSRLHDRIAFNLTDSGLWKMNRLAP